MKEHFDAVATRDINFVEPFTTSRVDFPHVFSAPGWEMQGVNGPASFFLIGASNIMCSCPYFVRRVLFYDI